MISDAMVEAALKAWFSGPQTDTDMGLARSMRAALAAAYGTPPSTGEPLCQCLTCGRMHRPMGFTKPKFADDERRMKEIQERVRPTIGPTFSFRGETIEGRISEDDFNYLMRSWLARPGASEAMDRICAWMASMGYATGHGDSIEDLLNNIPVAKPAPSSQHPR